MESVSSGGNGNSINPTLENGDLFDEDTGEHLATVDLGNTHNNESPPAQLSIFFNGFWYVYKIDSRYEEEKEELPPESPLTPRPE